MKKSIIAITLLATLAMGDGVEKYDLKEVEKTKEIYAYSQLLGETRGLNTVINIQKYKKKGFFESFSNNSNPNWESEVFVLTKIEDCVTKESIKKVKDLGYSFKSYSADVMLAGYREAVNTLKKDGAKFIVFDFVQSGIMPKDDGVYTILKSKKKIPYKKNEIFYVDEKENVFYYSEKDSLRFKNNIYKNFSFESFFMDKIKNDHFTKNPEEQYEDVPSSCYSKEDISLFGFLGQIVMLGVGVAGASSGNTNMTEFAGHGSNAISVSPKKISSKEEVQDSNELRKWSGIMNYHKMNVHGVVDSEYYDRNLPNMKITGYMFSIEEIETFLNKFPKINYKVKEN